MKLKNLIEPLIYELFWLTLSIVNHEWMTNMENIQIQIDEQISGLELSDCFKQKCRDMGFQRLRNITEILPSELLSREGFDYDWFEELVNYLSDRKLLYLLQPTPGNNPG